MLEEQAVRIEIGMAQILGRTTLALAKLLLAALKNQKNSQKFGRQNLAQLSRQGRQLSSAEVDTSQLRLLQKELKHYAVDFTYQKDAATGKALLWFKAQDADRIQGALENVVAELGKKPEHPLRPSLKEICASAIQKAAALNAEHTAKVPVPDRGERV